jgi:hypothetical protein
LINTGHILLIARRDSWLADVKSAVPDGASGASV